MIIEKKWPVCMCGEPLIWASVKFDGREYKTWGCPGCVFYAHTNNQMEYALDNFKQGRFMNPLKLEILHILESIKPVIPKKGLAYIEHLAESLK